MVARHSCLLPPLFLLRMFNYSMVLLNFSCIMEYDRTFLIDKKSPSIGMASQLSGALGLLQLFFSEKKWPNTFHLFGEITGKVL